MGEAKGEVGNEGDEKGDVGMGSLLFLNLAKSRTPTQILDPSNILLCRVCTITARVQRVG